jgi:hypothetical protein
MHRNKLAAMATSLALMLVMALAIGVIVAEERDLQPEVSGISAPCQNDTLGSNSETSSTLAQVARPVKCPPDKPPCTAECPNGITTCEICCGDRQTCKATQCTQTKAKCVCVDRR